MTTRIKKPLQSAFLNHPQISFGAKGLFAYLNGKEIFSSSSYDIACETWNSDEEIKKYIDELIKFEYLVIENDIYVLRHKPLSKSTDIDRANTKKIFALWNAQGVVNHRVITPAIEHQIEKALRIYTVDEIILGVTNYSNIYKSKYTWWEHKWTLDEFIMRKNGLAVFIYKTEKDYYDKIKIKGTPIEKEVIIDELAERKRLKDLADKLHDEKIDRERMASEKENQMLIKYWKTLSEVQKKEIYDKADKIIEHRQGIKDQFPGLYETYRKQAVKQVASEFRKNNP